MASESKSPNFRVVMLAKRKARVEIYDQIGPSWAGMIDAKLVSQAIKDVGELDGIELHINSPGGSAFDGLAIMNILRDHPARVEVVIDGLAASAASLVAMAGDSVRMPKNALMMLHDPATVTFGTTKDHDRAIEMLDKVKLAAIQTYAAKTTKSHDAIQQWMSDETWFAGDEAVEAGLADTTDKELPKPPVESKAAAAELYQRAPHELASRFAVAMQAINPKPEIPMSEAAQVDTALADLTAKNRELKTENNRLTDEVGALKTNIVKMEAAALNAAESKNTEISMVKTDTIAATLVAERSRVTDIIALCAKTGKPDWATKYILEGTATVDVQKALLEVLCAANKPIGEGSAADLTASPDEDAQYKSEYAKQKSLYLAAGLSEEDYVKTRRIDDRKDVLSHKVLV
jgi:ATP-dependent protease ClpP protease subunit